MEHLGILRCRLWWMGDEVWPIESVFELMEVIGPKQFDVILQDMI